MTWTLRYDGLSYRMARPVSLAAAQTRAVEIFNLECAPDELALYRQSDTTTPLTDDLVHGGATQEIIIVKLKEIRRRKNEVRAEKRNDDGSESEREQEVSRGSQEEREDRSTAEGRIWDRQSTPSPPRSTTATRKPVTRTFSPLTPSP